MRGSILRTMLWITLPLRSADNPDGDDMGFEVATLDFDTGLQVEDKFEVANWRLGRNGEIEFSGLVGVVKRVIQIFPRERVTHDHTADVFQISLYIEMAEKEKISDICNALKQLNPGRYVTPTVS
ncbi:MAG: hypothetical protein AAFR26_21535 [Cyanobacteria bacterium J06626_4]